MYGLYSRAASNQERPMMARVRYLLIIDQHDSCKYVKSFFFLVANLVDMIEISSTDLHALK